LDCSGEDVANNEPNSIIKAFARKKADATKAAKQIMQGEVDQPVSFGDFGSDFNPQDAFFTHHPWLLPNLPIVLPLSNIVPKRTELTNPTIADLDQEIPDYIDMTDLDQEIPDHIQVSESESHSDNIVPPNSDDSVVFLVSDGSDSLTEDRMAERGRRTPDQEMTMILDPTSGSDFDFPDSPMDTRTEPNQVRFLRDPTTGLFTPASFSQFPDDLID
jgi:hypothetical protein